MNNKKKFIIIVFSICLMLLVVGFSYAFFMYGKTGLYTHTINGGKMGVVYNEVTGNNITIDNAYPLSDEEALTKGLEFEFTITGYNESDKNVYYAIEMDYGEDIDNKNRFLDSDMKLSLYENDELVMENEIFENLNDQGIYYGYIKSGTNKNFPTLNDYRLRIWINDNVYLNDTLENDISKWDEMDYRWAESNLDIGELALIENDEVNTLEELGKSVYKTELFANSYANFKVNVIANLSGNDMEMLFYDANGGEFTPKNTSLLTNRVTIQKPVKENKGFLGWSSDPNAIEPEYKAGDYYSGPSQVLYAVYGNTKNVMGSLDPLVDEFNGSVGTINVSKAYFVNDTQENIDARYNASPIKADLTYNNQGSVKAWLEEDNISNWYGSYYKMYIGSEGTTYLNEGTYLFSGLKIYGMEALDLDNVDTSMLTDMSYMFSGGDYLQYSMVDIVELDLSGFNTSNVTNMSHMFERLPYIKEIDLTSFDMSKVEDMSYMFYYCESLEKLNIKNVDTSKVTNMRSMFENCDKIKTLDLRELDTSNVTNMSRMFNYCNNLNDLNISTFDTSKVEDMSYMFFSCDKIKKLNLTNFNTSKVTNMQSMFAFSDLSNLNISKFDTSNVSNMDGMFEYCQNIKTLDLGNFDTRNVIDISQMFSYCTNLVTLNVSNFDTRKVEDMSYMFDFCVNLIELDVSNFNTGNVTNMEYLFRECKKLKEIDVSNFDTKNVTTMALMFYNCENITMLDVSNWDTSKVKNMDEMFCYCLKLETIYCDDDGWDISSVTTSFNMFAHCYEIKGAFDYGHGYDATFANPDAGYFTRI